MTSRLLAINPSIEETQLENRSVRGAGGVSADPATGSPECPGPPPPLLPTLAPHGTPSVSRKPTTSPVLKRLKFLPLNILRRNNSLHNMCRAPRKVFRASPHRDPCSMGFPVTGPTDTGVQSGAQKLQQERRLQRILLSPGASAPRTKDPSHGPGAAADRPSWGQAHKDRIQSLRLNHSTSKTASFTAYYRD